MFIEVSYKIIYSHDAKNLDSDCIADTAKTTGWVETGVRIKPYWQSENDAS